MVTFDTSNLLGTTLDESLCTGIGIVLTSSGWFAEGPAADTHFECCWDFANVSLLVPGYDRVNNYE
jgi:hypothetical protein